MPLFPHDNFVSSRGYDFQEILAGPHSTTGKAWDIATIQNIYKANIVWSFN